MKKWFIMIVACAVSLNAYAERSISIGETAIASISSVSGVTFVTVGMTASIYLLSLGLHPEMEGTFTVNGKKLNPRIPFIVCGSLCMMGSLALLHAVCR